MKRYKIKFVTHRLPHCRLLSPRCSLEGDLCSRKCMIVFLTYFHLHMTHCKMTIESMLKALKIQFLWGWRKGQKWVRSPLSTVKQLLKSNVTPLYHSLAWEFLQIFVPLRANQIWDPCFLILRRLFNFNCILITL